VPELQVAVTHQVTPGLHLFSMPPLIFFALFFKLKSLMVSFLSLGFFALSFPVVVFLVVISASLLLLTNYSLCVLSSKAIPGVQARE
jgi:hypothetical protein